MSRKTLAVCVIIALLLSSNPLLARAENSDAILPTEAQAADPSVGWSTPAMGDGLTDATKATTLEYYDPVPTFVEPGTPVALSEQYVYKMGDAIHGTAIFATVVDGGEYRVELQRVDVPEAVEAVSGFQIAGTYVYSFQISTTNVAHDGPYDVVVREVDGDVEVAVLERVYLQYRLTWTSSTIVGGAPSSVEGSVTRAEGQSLVTQVTVGIAYPDNRWAAYYTLMPASSGQFVMAFPVGDLPAHVGDYRVLVRDGYDQPSYPNPPGSNPGTVPDNDAMVYEKLARRFVLNVYTSGTGSVTRSPDQASYAAGTEVTLTATPSPGYVFAGWSGDLTGATNPASVMMDGDKSIVASFEWPTQTLTVNVVGSGSVTKSPDLPAYSRYSGITLTAVPAPGWHFAGWSGDFSGAANPAYVGMDKDKVVYATFAIGTAYVLNVNTIGAGFIERVPAQASYAPDTLVTLTANPEYGWHFVEWSDDVTGTANPTTVTMNTNKLATATFAVDSHQLAVTTVGSGSVTKTPEQSSYVPGAGVMLTATPDDGWRFAGWSGGFTGMANPFPLTMGAQDLAATATFVPSDTWILSVNVAGAGSVARSPNQASYAAGTEVTLTATPSPGYAFTGWSGDLTGATNLASITMDGDKAITAVFAMDTHILMVNVVGSGSVIKSPDLSAYPSNLGVFLAAIPAPGWHFVGWSGAVNGASKQVVISMNEDRAVTATFAYGTVFTLNVYTSGTGSVTRSPDQASYAAGTEVTLTATPSPGYVFAGWSGDLTGATNPASVMMDGDKSIVASFEWPTQTLTVNVVGSGSVTKSPDLPAYSRYSGITLTAVPAPGWHFAGWSGDFSGAANPAYVGMDKDKVVYATFAIGTAYVLNVNTIGAGFIERVPAQASYAPDTLVTLTANPEYGWHFVEWSDDVTGTANPTTVTMNTNKLATATFAVDSHQLAVTTVGSGSVTKTPEQSSYVPGAGVMLTATPDDGWRFAGWSGGFTGMANPFPLTMGAQDLAATATFVPSDTWILSVNVAGAGSVARSPNQASYAAGTEVTLTATPSPGYAFTGWSGDLTGATNLASITMDGDKAITAVFAMDTHILMVNVVGSGSVIKSPDLSAYPSNLGVFLAAIPAPGWHFVGWSGAVNGASKQVVISMNEDRAVTATFAYGTVFTLNVYTSGTGSVTRSPDQASYAAGTEVTLTATPSPGYVFAGWSGDLTGATNPASVMMDGDKSIVASFEWPTQTLTVNVVGSGSVTKSPDLPAYSRYSGITLTAVPAPGWHFAGWSGDFSGAANPAYVGMDKDKVVYATFAIGTAYVLNVNTIGAGFIERVPAQASYAPDTLVTLTANPEYGWHFVEWSDDVTGTANPTTVTMNTNKLATATFAVDSHQLAVTTVGSGSVTKTPEQSSYVPGAGVMLTATPDDGWRFAGWSGGFTGMANPFPLTMGAQDLAATATFVPSDTWILSVNVAGAGSVARSPNQASYAAGTEVTLTATPSPGYAFTGWSGDLTGATNLASITMDGDKAITAVFAMDTHILMVNVVGSGSVIKSPDLSAYPSNLGVFLAAIPAPGWHFVGWSGAVNGASKQVSVTMDADKTVTATFTVGAISSLIVHYYLSLLDRSPDEAGFAFWQSEIARIQSLGIDVKEGFIALARLFLTSPEYVAKGTTPTAYVTDLYEAFFDRIPTSPEVTHWTDLMAGGMSRDNTMNWFVYSPEFAAYMTSVLGSSITRPENNLVNDLYRGFLNRLPDNTGFAAHLTAMRTAQATGAAAVRSTTLAIALGFLGSPEYTLRARTNAQFIEDCYNGILRRGALVAEVQSWVDLLTAGATRIEVLTSFVNSPEFQARVDLVIAAGPFIP